MLDDEVRPEDVIGEPPRPRYTYDDPEKAREAGRKGVIQRNANMAERRRKAERSRVELSVNFLDDVHTLWKEHGKTILARAAFAHPEKMAKIVADLMPKQLEVKSNAIQDLDDDRLSDLIGALSERFGRGVEASLGEAQGRAGAPVIDAEAVELQALPKAE